MDDFLLPAIIQRAGEPTPDLSSLRDPIRLPVLFLQRAGDPRRRRSTTTSWPASVEWLGDVADNASLYASEPRRTNTRDQTDPAIIDASWRSLFVPEPAFEIPVEPSGDPQFDTIAQRLVHILAEVGTEVGSGSGNLYGLRVHSAFAKRVREANIPGVEVEQSFFAGASAKYGFRGSIRTDVLLRNASGRIIAVWDVKTGSARLTVQRANQIRQYLDVNEGVPVRELHLGPLVR